MREIAAFPLALLVLFSDVRVALADIALPDPEPQPEPDMGILPVSACVIVVALVALLVIRRLRK